MADPHTLDALLDAINTGDGDTARAIATALAHAVDKPVCCPECGGTVFVIDQMVFNRQDFDSATNDWGPDYDLSCGGGDDYPYEARCKECGVDCTDLLNADTVQFYNLPPEREAPVVRQPVDPFLASLDVRS